MEKNTQVYSEEANDKAILDRLEKRFELLRELVHGVAKGHLDAVMVTGQGGLGKTHTVTSVLSQYEAVAAIKVKKFKGHVTPLDLYNALYINSDPDCVVLFDDCDAAFQDVTSMNILKAATDSTYPRMVAWASSSSKVEVPEYEFKGRIIIVTNGTVDNSPHQKAFADRLVTFDMSMSSREKILKIAEISTRVEGISPDVAAKVVDWIKTNEKDIGKNLSLRSFTKAAKLASYSDKWEELAAMMMIDC